MDIFFSFTLMIWIAAEADPNDRRVHEIPGLSQDECFDAAMELVQRRLVPKGSTHCRNMWPDPFVIRPRPAD
ncbi:MAG: hypothetical protein WAO08_38680 [Hyphomicrobiaceae bacterium]